MSVNYKIVYLFIFLFVITGKNSYCQPARIYGQVIDNETDIPIPFANVYIKGTSAGTIANDSGYYELSTRLRKDSITATFLGYKSVSAHYKLRETQEINFKLEKSLTTFDAVVVKPTENPAHRILRKVWKQKKSYDKKTYDVQFQTYNKVQMKLSNIDEKFKNRKVLKPFKFVFDNIDTNAITGKTYLPILISETSSDIYYQKDPAIEKEVINASQISGINNESIKEFVGGINQSFDPFQNYMSFYSESGFISPFAESGLLFYRYYITDSSEVNGKKIYTIQFHPRRKQERTFIGTFKADVTSGNVTQLEMHINPEANLNFITELNVEYQFEPINDSVLFLKREHLLVDFNLADWKNLKGLQGEKTTIYSNFKFNAPIPQGIKDLQERLTYIDTTSSNYLVSNRPEQLSTKEAKVYQMVDSIKNVPAFRTTYDIISTLVDAHFNFGKFKIGPYFSIYSYNKVEGHRFRIGGTTNSFFSNKVKLTAYTAYGTYDQKFKYYANGIFILNNSPRISFNALYSHDVSQLNLAPGVLLNDNIVSSFLRRNPFTKLQMIDNISGYLESDISDGITAQLGFNHITVFPGPYIPFINPRNGNPVAQISSNEFNIGLHLESGQKFIKSKFKRFRLRNENPAFDIKITTAPNKGLHNKYHYWKFRLGMSQYLTTNPFGFNRYSIEVGKTKGIAPWPLLEIMGGNETYGLYRYAFNMMNFYEFVADEYVSVSTEQHLQGMILNYIPLLRKLKFREVISAKGVIGRIDHRNVDELKLPSYMHSLNKPYLEVGVGVENIFKLLRIDALWRLTHKNNPDIEIFGIRARFQFML